MERQRLSSSVEHLWLAALESDMPSPDPDLQSKLFAEVNAAASAEDEGAPQRRNSTLFTSSGNHFVFDELRQRSAGASDGSAPRDVMEDARTLATIDTPPTTPAVVPATPTTAQSPLAPTPSNAARSNQLVEMVAAAVEQMGVDDAPGGVGGEEGIVLAKEFIDKFRRPNKPLSSAVKQLEDMLRFYPQHVYVARVARCSPPGQLELCCAREAVIHAIKDDTRFPNLVFTSFERGLKHAGLYVTQTTHGKVPIKRWGFKDTAAVYGDGSGKKVKSAERKRPRDVPSGASPFYANGAHQQPQDHAHQQDHLQQPMARLSAIASMQPMQEHLQQTRAPAAGSADSGAQLDTQANAERMSVWSLRSFSEMTTSDVESLAAASGMPVAGKRPRADAQGL